MIEKNRIHALDGLRVISILLVMLYHYYYRFDGVKYSYSFKTPEFLYYGKLGVALFFVISGFVITLTLTRCNNLIEFVKKRFIRLIPAMLICSFVTFLIFILFDKSNLFPAAADFKNVIVSNTFIKPSFFNRILHLNLEYTDGAYWSIWIELQFYMIAGVLYFLSPKNLLRNFAIYTAITTTYFLYNKYNVNPIQGTVSYIYGHYDLWFLSGIIVNKLYLNPKHYINLIYLILVIAIQMFIQSNVIAIFCSAMIALTFIAFVYKQEYLSFLESKILGKIGVATYSIYLIHQNIGVLFINTLSPYFGSLNWILPILAMMLITAFGLFSFSFIEKPIGNILKSILFQKSANKPLPVAVILTK